MKKTYTISVDHEVMESFQKKCDGKKFSPEIERLLNCYVNDQLVFTDETDGKLEEVRESIRGFKAMTKALEDAIDKKGLEWD